jgi:hypothetical protein
MLLIGGFTIAAALSKTRMDVIMATRILNLAGTRPSVVLLSQMAVATFASMWISNVAAPTLCFALIKVGSCYLPRLSMPWTLTFCAAPAHHIQASLRLQLYALPHCALFHTTSEGICSTAFHLDRNRARVQHRRNGLAYLFASKSHRPRCHGAASRLAPMVRHLSSRRIVFCSSCALSVLRCAKH